MFRLLIVPVVLFTLPVIALATSPETRGLEIAIQADKANEGFKGESSETQMTLINAHGDKTIRRMKMKSKETKNDGDKTIVTFLWPADVKGTKMLTWTHKTSDDDQWLYLPALRRVKRISARSKTGSFMGSEFSYEDLSSQEVEKYKYKFLRDEKLESRNTWVLERIPNDKNSGYSKQVMWMDKEYMNPVKIDYFDRKGELLKTATFSGYKKMKKWWRAAKLAMVNHQTKKKSVLTWDKRVLGKSFTNRDFHKNKLKD
jgi:hypothetical protein